MDELKEIADFLELGEIKSVEDAPGNANRNSYVTTHKGRYLIKIIEERVDVNEVVSEISYLKRLEGQVKMVTYVENSKGESLFDSGGVIAIAQEYLENTTLACDEDLILQVVTEQAKLHLIDCTDLPQREHWIDLGYINRTLDKLEEHNQVMNADLLRGHVSMSQDWSKCSTGIVHGDLHLGNVLFNSNKDLLAIIDWEEVGTGYYILDLGMTIVAFCFRDDKFNAELFKKMIDAYETLKPLTNIEKQLIHQAIQRAFITVFVWRAARHFYQGRVEVYDAKDCDCFKHDNLLAY